MTPWTLPKIKTSPLTQTAEKTVQKSTKNGPNSKKARMDFYPDNLYKVIADFRQKHSVKRDVAELSFDENLSDDITIANRSVDGSPLSDPPPFMSTSRREQKTDSLQRDIKLDRSWLTRNYPGVAKIPGSLKTHKKVSYSMDPFPRLSAQTVRCQTCCARLNLPYSKGSSSISSSPTISYSSSEGGSPMGHHNCPYGKSNHGGAPKPVRRSYKISHFDDTYSSNEKRSKVETNTAKYKARPITDSTGKLIGAPRWRY